LRGQLVQGRKRERKGRKGKERKEKDERDERKHPEIESGLRR